MAYSKDKGWLAVQAAVNKEQFVVDGLKRQNFSAWYPKIWKHIKHARKTTLKQKPLFPGYVFVSAESQNQVWRPIESTFGVVRLVKFGNRPARLSGELMSGLFDLADDSGTISFRSNLVIGEHARVVSGAFDAWIGQVVGLPDSERVTLLLNILSRKVPVTLPRGSVIKAA